MKYIVMECHEGYAVLMDEDSRFVQAANLRYKTGQTVTDPVLMSSPAAAPSRRISVYISRFAAAAACLTLAVSAGAYYYSHNYKTHSTVLISSEANISMELNKKGKVIHITTDNFKTDEILEDYDGKGKDMLTVANDIIDREKDKGYIEDGDTVDIYIRSDDTSDYYSYKSDLITGIPDVKVKVQEYDALKTNVKETAEPAKPEPAKDEKKPEPPKPPHEEKDKPEPPKPDAAAPPAPAAPAPDGNAAPAPKADTPPAPAAPEAPKPPAAEAPKPDAAAPPAPAAPAPADPKLNKTVYDGNSNLSSLSFSDISPYKAYNAPSPEVPSASEELHKRDASREALPDKPPPPPSPLPNP